MPDAVRPLSYRQTIAWLVIAALVCWFAFAAWLVVLATRAAPDLSTSVEPASHG